MKKTLLQLILIFMSLVSFSQNSIKVIVNDSYGIGIANAEVYFCGNLDCQTKKTNNEGEVLFQMLYQPTAVIAYDPNGKYGIAALSLNQSAHTYTIQLPDMPSSDRQAGEQLDNVWNEIVMGMGIYKDLDELADVAVNIQMGASFGGLALPSQGVPGVFSMSPLPTIGPDGKLGWSLSGVLVDKIVAIALIPNRIVFGKKVYYQYYPSY